MSIRKVKKALKAQHHVKRVIKRRRREPTPLLAPGLHSSYAVLKEVLGIIKDEPKRLNMSDWIFMVEGEPTAMALCPIAKKDQPACGTVACVAGWINVITGKYGQDGSYSANGALTTLGLDQEVFDYTSPIYHARRALERVFYMENTHRKVLTAIRKVMREHKEVLMNHTVEIPEDIKANFLA